MTDAERIEIVERHRLDVWYHDSTNPMLPPGWVADLGEPDESLWTGGGADGGTSLAVGQPSWRAAVDEASVALALLNLHLAAPFS